ncbi:ATP phosphoribosyltransferase regulatory subunit [Litoreibacter ascidiaceicola]|uniref:ATP phosphoribosyltransferase regulatory subunit n=1 Tax=Litoreibacter ascidiaceicola TaxID=1486859 RepID=A0A1M4ZJ69_9RHOB|nr:ATP phosphoribosyltransferase regulatory subunit [Litoreibacter ascidiaceicola]SHF17596.1 ATP phosphoribosyltransferase regulatory subunit [Litoreibacter ascidiaceicola]
MDRVRQQTERLSRLFRDAGAVPVETSVLQPADTLLDLYGEDIRARAYVTSDPVLGEQMLRPDFTVPVVQRHMEEGAEPARYTYQGLVFRKQEAGTGRASEYTQVGYEVFDRTDPSGADAEVFALFAQALEGVTLDAFTGDIGILTAAVAGLSTTERRRSALLRHLWRPMRFRALLERFSVPASRVVPQLVSDLPEIGLRSSGEVEARLAALREDAQTAPLDATELRALQAILEVSDVAPNALASLRKIADGLPAISGALDQLEARLSALASRGVDVDQLNFSGAYGRTTMEYYDGFVFGFHADAQVPVATGGRYDALTRVLGQGREIPAVGGVIRPELLEALA